MGILIMSLYAKDYGIKQDQRQCASVKNYRTDCRKGRITPCLRARRIMYAKMSPRQTRYMGKPLESTAGFHKSRHF